MKSYFYMAVAILGLGLLSFLGINYFLKSNKNPAPLLGSVGNPGAPIEKEKIDSQLGQDKGSPRNEKEALFPNKPNNREISETTLSSDLINSLLTDPALAPERLIFQQGRERFTVLPGLVAISTDEASEYDPKAIVGKVLGLTVIKSKVVQSSEKAYPIVVESRRGSLALVTGNLKIQHAESLDLPKLEEAFGLKLLQNFTTIQVSIFSSQTNQVKSLLQIAESMRTISGVERVTLELIDRMRSPN